MCWSSALGQCLHPAKHHQVLQHRASGHEQGKLLTVAPSPSSPGVQPRDIRVCRTCGARQMGSCGMVAGQGGASDPWRAVPAAGALQGQQLHPLLMYKWASETRTAVANRVFSLFPAMICSQECGVIATVWCLPNKTLCAPGEEKDHIFSLQSFHLGQTSRILVSMHLLQGSKQTRGRLFIYVCM